MEFLHQLFVGQYLKLRALQRQSYTHYFYEATVGAGLPIVSTLRGLLETGDKILRIEGIFRYVHLRLSFLYLQFRAFRMLHVKQGIECMLVLAMYPF